MQTFKSQTHSTILVMPHDLEEENSSEDNSKVLFCHANKNDLAILKEEIRQSVSVVDDLIDRHP